MTCEHTLADIDTAAHWDGKCPLCMEAEIERLTAEMKEFRNAAADALKSKDEVERLRRIDYEEIERVAKLEAEIERLRAHIKADKAALHNAEQLLPEIERLKAALQEIASLSHNCRGTDIARAALEGK